MLLANQNQVFAVVLKPAVKGMCGCERTEVEQEEEERAYR